MMRVVKMSQYLSYSNYYAAATSSQALEHAHFMPAEGLSSVA